MLGFKSEFDESQSPQSRCETLTLLLDILLNDSTNGLKIITECLNYQNGSLNSAKIIKLSLEILEVTLGLFLKPATIDQSDSHGHFSPLLFDTHHDSLDKIMDRFWQFEGPKYLE